ncbi:MAG: hypothetical protein O2930_02670 [Acidobacteria bacterium]|nr:hypothetical protein [Acidobacteriota bacterium]
MPAMLTTYSIMLTLHSILRWVILIAGLLAVARACSGWIGGRIWGADDNRAGIWFVAALDLQLLVGLVLHVILSPLTQIAMSDPAAAMQNSALRFWFVEHPFGMVVALVLAHVGRVRIRKAATDISRHKAATIFFTLALIVIVLASPWPGMANARPLLPW